MQTIKRGTWKADVERGPHRVNTATYEYRYRLYYLDTVQWRHFIVGRGHRHSKRQWYADSLDVIVRDLEQRHRLKCRSAVEMGLAMQRTHERLERLYDRDTHAKRSRRAHTVCDNGDGTHSHVIIE
jgi:hypothetical protein